MLPLRPVDLPEARAELAQWYLDGHDVHAFEVLATSRSQQHLSGIGHLNDRDGDGPTTLRAADLYYVEPDMMELAIHAAKTLPDFNLLPEDLPSPSGSSTAPDRFGRWRPTSRWSASRGAGTRPTSTRTGRWVSRSWSTDTTCRTR